MLVDAPPTTCPRCGAASSSSLACLACGRVLQEASGASHYTRLGIAPRPDIDPGALETTYLRISRVLHPDFHGGSDDALRELALRNSALLNEAFSVLNDPQLRAEYLLGLHDAEALERCKQLDPAFLIESMELSEAIEEAGTRADRAALARHGEHVRAEIEVRAAAVADLAAWNEPDTKRLATSLHELRVLRRILRDLERLT
jgi:molecular chaperone HscB